MNWNPATFASQFYLIAIACHGNEYGEAPMLKKRVEAGELPPVQERLPANPPVVEVIESIGRYGGEIRTITPVATWLVEEVYMMREPLLRFASDGVTIKPNVAERWELAKDARSILVQLREGMRWSDGKPVTTEDVRFAWEDVLLNKDITPVPPANFVVDDEPMGLEVLDATRFRLSFRKPYGSVLYALIQSVNDAALLMPKHYLRRYHPKYAPMDEITATASDRGFDHWFELFRDVNHTVRLISAQTSPDYPTLGAWRVMETPVSGHVILERNPYYWKVDPKGNQLPYINRIHSEYVGTEETRNLLYVSGEIDFAQTPMQNAPLLLSNRERGNYSVRFWHEIQGSRVTLFLNQTYPDPVFRELFQNPQFRIALSLAIDRKEINEILFFGKSNPRQWTVNPASSFYDPQWEKSYAEHDPAEANRILDELGLVRKGPQGWRHLPDGRQVIINPVVIEGGFRPQSMELVADYWSEIGVLLSWRVVRTELVMTKRDGNLLDLAVFPCESSSDIGLIFHPLLQINYWAPLWSDWFHSKGRLGEEPPRKIQALWATWTRMRETGDKKERIHLGKEIVESQSENLYGIGLVGSSMNAVLAANRLQNVPGDGVLVGWPFGVASLYHAEQFFVEGK